MRRRPDQEALVEELFAQLDHSREVERHVAVAGHHVHHQQTR